jgi:hypothetical protein
MWQGPFMAATAVGMKGKITPFSIKLQNQTAQ